MSNNPLSPESIQARAAQLGGSLPVPGEIIKLPNFEVDFVSARFPSMNGKVKLRFPNFRDEVEMARQTQLLGNTLLGQSIAVLQVCCEAAPASWYRPAKDGIGLPTLEVGQLYDTPSLIDLVTRWVEWRDSFRETAPGPNNP